MKTINKICFKYVFTIINILIVFCSIANSQTPMYYNTNTGTSLNSFPFNVAAGKGVQWMLLAHELNQPSTAPPGYITKIYFYTGNTQTSTFYYLTIKLGQTDITSFPTGVMYSGPMDTVYYRYTGNLSSTIHGWMGITLDHPYTYDTSLSLVIEASQCGYTSSGGILVYQSLLTGVRRNYLNPTNYCTYTYSGQDAYMINIGFDITPLSGISKNENDIPSNYKLEQNYPNPFNPSTSISFSLPKEGYVIIDIYDILGGKVSSIVHKHYNAGDYKVTFDAADLVSGMYFYTLRVNEFTETKKMIIIK